MCGELGYLLPLKGGSKEDDRGREDDSGGIEGGKKTVGWGKTQTTGRRNL